MDKFQTTHGDFWGESVLPYWVFLIVTVLPLTGFFGIDHLLFKSASTACAKGITNIFSLGFWYFYDILQAFGDKEYVDKYGLSIPAIGAAGLGYKYFSGVSASSETHTNTNTTTKKAGILSVVIFIAYVFSLFLPFGIRHFIAGDTNAGLIEFLLTFAIIWIPFFWFGGAYEGYRLLFHPDKVFTEGGSRSIPLTLMMSNTGYSPNIMNPESLKAVENSNKDAVQSASVFSFFVKPILGFFGVPDPAEVLDTARCDIVKPVKDVVNTGLTAVEGVKNIASTVPMVASEAVNKMSAFTDPAKLAEAVASSTLLQQKGGSISDISTMDMMVVGGIGLLIVGGFTATFLRKIATRTNELDVKGDDSPPKPRNV